MQVGPTAIVAKFTAAIPINMSFNYPNEITGILGGAIHISIHTIPGSNISQQTGRPEHHGRPNVPAGIGDMRPPTRTKSPVLLLLIALGTSYKLPSHTCFVYLIKTLLKATPSWNTLDLNFLPRGYYKDSILSFFGGWGITWGVLYKVCCDFLGYLLG